MTVPYLGGDPVHVPVVIDVHGDMVHLCHPHKPVAFQEPGGYSTRTETVQAESRVHSPSDTRSSWPPSRANTRHTPCYPKPRCRPQTRPVTPEQLLFFTNPYSSHQTLPDHEEENQEAFHPQQRHISEEEADVEGGHPGQVLQGQAGSTVTGTKRLSPHLFLCIRCGHSPRHPGWTVSSQLPSPAVSSATAPSF